MPSIRHFNWQNDMGITLIIGSVALAVATFGAASPLLALNIGVVVSLFATGVVVGTGGAVLIDISKKDDMAGSKSNLSKASMFKAPNSNQAAGQRDNDNDNSGELEVPLEL